MNEIATDIGTRLRQAREARGMTLRDIATATKISMRALVAIEHNDFARLPGGVFRRAYVRAFAAEVGLNADELAREYRARFEPEPPAGPLLPHDTQWTHRLRLAQRWPAVLVIIVGLVIGASLIVKRGAVPHDAPDGGWMLDAVEIGLPEEVTFPRAAVADIRAPTLRLEIRTTGPCWVSAVADGERVVYRLMQPGERTLVEAGVAITLRVGDAGTIAYSINGAAGRPLGRNGEVVTVRITHDNLRRLYADPAAADAPERAATRS